MMGRGSYEISFGREFWANLRASLLEKKLTMEKVSPISVKFKIPHGGTSSLPHVRFHKFFRLLRHEKLSKGLLGATSRSTALS